LTMKMIRRTRSAPRSALFGLLAAWRFLGGRQASRRALDTLPDYLLKDIGLRRLPAGLSSYEEAVHKDAEPEHPETELSRDVEHRDVCLCR
jgi:uncharacterized protein YjiS (DUF1127 family)